MFLLYFTKFLISQHRMLESGQRLANISYLNLLSIQFPLDPCILFFLLF